MSRHTFQPAELKHVRLRILITGPSGSGKTYTALKIATGLAGEGGVVGLIDSERGSSELYADRFEFLVSHLQEERSIEAYIDALRTASEAGIDVLVIDSLTHAWHYLLDRIDQLAIQRYGGNSWSAWARGRPYQRKFVDAFLQFPGHLICTARVKTAWELVEDDRGRKSPQKLGLKPDQDGDLEYEFHAHLGMDMAHMGTVHADKTGQLEPTLGKVIESPDEEVGLVLLRFLQNGALRASTELTKAQGDAGDPEAFRQMLAERFPDAEPPEPLRASTELTNAQGEAQGNAHDSGRSRRAVLENWSERMKARFLTGLRDAGFSQEEIEREFGVDEVNRIGMTETEGERLRAILAHGVTRKALSLDEVKQALGVDRVIDLRGVEPKAGFAAIDRWIETRAA